MSIDSAKSQGDNPDAIDHGAVDPSLARCPLCGGVAPPGSLAYDRLHAADGGGGKSRDQRRAELLTPLTYTVQSGADLIPEWSWIVRLWRAMRERMRN